MPGENRLEEYVQNDVGRIWKGDHKSPEGKPWIFGQFSVLPECCVVLDRCSMLRPADRGNPIRY